MFASSRLTASRFAPKLSWTVGIGCALLGLSAAPATALAGEPMGCEAHLYSQPFSAFGDLNYYKLAPGGNFNSPKEGWELTGGAQIIQATRPGGTTGGVLDVPSGAQAISPPEPVTLNDPTARVWVADLKGAEGVKVSVAYENTKTALHPKDVGHVHGQHTSWTLATAFNIQPQIAGPEEGVRIVRFVFQAGGKGNDTQLYGLWVDPRLRTESRLVACGSNGGALVRGAQTGEAPLGVN